MTEETIDKILKANKLEDVLDIADLGTQYKQIAKLIHPDVYKGPHANEAIARLNELKDKFENGIVFSDETGTFKTNGYWADFNSTEKCLEWSFENYGMFKKRITASDIHFHNYIPADSLVVPGGLHRFTFNTRAIPISGLQLAQEHVNWILNRLLEYCAYMAETEFVHCGLNPESVFIVPDTHGIQICSFYHLTRFGNRVKTVSGKYKSWYPPQLFTTKVAESTIDVECAKKIAIYLLGDQSGTGIKLKKTHNEKFMDFVIKQHDNAHEAWHEYRELLKDNFEKKFYPLNI